MSRQRADGVLRHLHAVLPQQGARQQSDRELLQRFAAGRDEQAFAELVRRHGAMVLAVCRRVLHHQQDAEDAFQRAFLSLARKAGASGWQESVGHWLYLVAHRLALRVRKQANRRPVPPLSVCNRNTRAILWDVATGRQRHLPRGHEKPNA